MHSNHTNAAARCPACLKTTDAATNLDGSDSGPKPEDLSMCASCGQLNVFNADLTLRSLPLAEFEALPAGLQIQLRTAQAALNRYRKQNPLGK